MTRSISYKQTQTLHYKVLVDARFDRPDPPLIDETLVSAEESQRIAAEYEKKVAALRVVPDRYSDVSLTPFSVTIEKGTGATASFDVTGGK